MADSRHLVIDRRMVSALSSKGTFYDSQLIGFGVRRTESGGVSYFVEYRPGAGGRNTAKRRMVIGRDGPAFRADAARGAAKTLLARIALGADPAGERVRARKAETVAEILAIYMERHARPMLKATTVASYDGQVRNYLIPAFGPRRAADLRREDVARLHRTVGATGPGLANRIVALLNAAYEYSIKYGILGEDVRNPVRGVNRYREEGRERYLSDAEMTRLGQTLTLAETTGLPWRPDPSKKQKHTPKSGQTTILDKHAVAALRLLILTGARLREILHLEWSQVDFERQMLFLPTSKTGKKVIVLGAPALALLQNLERLGPYVIAGRPKSDGRGGLIWAPRHDLKKPWEQVTAHASLEGLRIHDLRHSFASVGAGAGLGLPIIGGLLGHKDAKTTARYAHLDAGPLHRAATAIATEIESAMTGAADAL